MFDWIRRQWTRRHLARHGLASGKRRLTAEAGLGAAADSSRLLFAFILLAEWLACLAYLLLPSQSTWSASQLGVGQLAPDTVFAEFDFVFVDSDATRAKGAQAAQAVSPVYALDDKASARMLAELSTLLDELAYRAELKPRPPDLAVDEPLRAFASELPKAAVDDIAFVLSSGGLKAVMESAEEVVYNGIMPPEDASRLAKPSLEAGGDAVPLRNPGVRVVDSQGRVRGPFNAPPPAPLAAADRFAAAGARRKAPGNRDAVRKAFYEVGVRVFEPNLVLDTARLERDRAAAAAADSNVVYVKTLKDDMIVQKGSVLTRRDIDKLVRYEQEVVAKSSQNRLNRILSMALYSLVLALAAFLLAVRIQPDLARSNQKMGAAAAAVILGMAGMAGGEEAFTLLAPAFLLPASLKSCLLPLAAPILVMTAIGGFRAAIHACVLASLVLALRFSDHVMAVSSLAICAAAAWACDGSRNYKAFFIRGWAAVSIATFAMEFLLLGKWSMGAASMLKAAGLCAANGVATAIVALPALFLIESVFQISTDMSMLAYADFDHPLLRRLQLEAPGTFQHSLLVANMAEQAANAIGANPVRARVCALYHDIGKLSKPDYFVENVLDGEDMHKELNPRMSSLVITSHVKEGVDLARKHKLLRIIVEAIEQHHGTDLVRFFYHKAGEEAKLSGSPVAEGDFRYPGPGPRRREVVLVSLADACEAASRALEKPNPIKIDAMVRDIFFRRLRDGQLDNADISTADLAAVRASFVKTITSMLHPRIAYPKQQGADNANPPPEQSQPPSTPAEPPRV